MSLIAIGIAFICGYIVGEVSTEATLANTYNASIKKLADEVAEWKNAR